MARPYISDEEAARIDAEAVRTGRPALRAPSESSWWRRLLDGPDTLSPAGLRVEDHLTPISDAVLHTGGRIRRGEYGKAVMGLVDAAAEVGMARAAGPKGSRAPNIPHPGKNLGTRGATAGYVAEKRGVPVSTVLKEHATKGKDLGAAARRRAAQAQKQRREAAARNRPDLVERAKLQDMSHPADLVAKTRSKAKPPDVEDYNFLQAVAVNIHNVAKRGSAADPNSVFPSSPDTPPVASPAAFLAAGTSEDWLLNVVREVAAISRSARRYDRADGGGHPIKTRPWNIGIEARLREIVRNPHVDVPPTLIEDLSSGAFDGISAYDAVKRAIAMRPDIPGETRVKLAATMSPYGIEHTLERKTSRFSAPEVGRLFDVVLERSKHDARYHSALARMTSRMETLTDAQKAGLAEHPSPYVRFQVARRKDLSPELTGRLAGDQDLYVAQAAIHSPSVTEDQYRSVMTRALRVMQQPSLVPQLQRVAETALRGILTDKRVPAGDIVWLLGRPELKNVSGGFFEGVPRSSRSRKGPLNTPSLESLLLRPNSRFTPEEKGQIAANLINLRLSSSFYSFKNGATWLGQQLGWFATDSGAYGSKPRKTAAAESRARMVAGLTGELRRLADLGGAGAPALRRMADVVDPPRENSPAEVVHRIPDSSEVRPLVPDQTNLGSAPWGEIESRILRAADLSSKEARDVTAAALKLNRSYRQATGGEVRPGDVSSKLGWFRDDDINALVRPTLQTTKPDTPPVVMWMHPTMGKTTMASNDANLIDFDTVRIRELKDMIRANGYPDYGQPNTESGRFSKTKWRHEHPGVIEQADAALLDKVMQDPESRGHIIVTSVRSHLRDRPDSMSLVLDMPEEAAVQRMMARDHLTREQALAWKRDIDKDMARFKDGGRYMASDLYLKDLVATPEFESLLSASGVPVSVVDTGVLGNSGMFVSGTAGTPAYAGSRANFQRRYSGEHGYGTVARLFFSLGDMLREGNEISFHDSDAGTGTLKSHLPRSIRSRVSRYYMPSEDFNGRTDARQAAQLALIRESDVQDILSSSPVFWPAGLRASTDLSRPLDPYIWHTPRKGMPMVDINSLMSGTGRHSKSSYSYIGDDLPAGSATPLERFKAMVAFRDLADVVREGPGYQFPSDFTLLGYKNLPATEFKTRTVPPDMLNAATRRVIVPSGYADTPQGRFLTRRYPHIELVPMDPQDKSGSFRALSAEATDDLREAAKAGDSPDRFSMSRNFLATDKVPDAIFGIPIVSREEDYTPEDLEFFHEHPEAGGYYDMGGGTPEDGTEEGEPVQADEAGDANPYAGMTVQQKLDRADELLKRYEGTDRYDEFKKRVDEMHAKYGQPAQQPAQQPGTSYLQMAEKATPWMKQGINTFNNIATGGGGTDLGLSQVLDAVHDTYQSASQSIIRAGRSKIAKFVADAGKQAATGVGEGTLKEAGFAREVATDLGRRGDLVLRQGTEGATEQAVNLYKGANDMKKTATGLEETARAAKATASRQARVKAMNHVIGTGYQQTLKTAARKAGVKAAAKVGVRLGARAVAGSVGPAAFATGAMESAVRQGAAMLDMKNQLGASWGDVGRATKSVFTTKQGWKNLGWGLLGSLKDVASSVTLGAVDDGDRLRERMQDAKGGRTVRADTDGGEAEEFMRRNPTLFSHVKSFEKLRTEPYEDVGGYAIGYGAHMDAAGNAVTADTTKIDEATADRLLARDLYARREKLARTLPNWSFIPGSAKQALLDVSMGKDGILSAKKSEGLHRDLAAAGKDREKLLAAVKKHYYSYLTKDPKYREGLMARRIAGGRTFFGEGFSYEGKTWDPVAGFVTRTAPSLPAKKSKASGCSTRSKGGR